MDYLLWPITLTSVLAAAAGVVVLWRRRRKSDRLGPGDLLVALLGAAVAGALGLGALRLVGLNLFGVMHLAYLGVVLTLPLIGAAALVLGHRGRRRGDRDRRTTVAAVVLLLPAALGWYGTHIEPHWLRVDTIQVPVSAERDGDDTVRIAVIADLQTIQVGDHEQEAIDAVLAAQPDVILLPGDLLQGNDADFEEQLPALRSLLAQLHAPHGVFFTRGDCDNGDRADRVFAGSDVRILDDEIVEVPVGDRLLRIGGYRLDYRLPSSVAVREELEALPEDGSIRILVGHRPDPVLDLPTDSRVDLVVAGHTHGGQVVVPGFGPPVTLSWVPREVARGGLHEVNGNAIYVSPGVGAERGQAPLVRIGNRPAVGILDLS